MMFLGVVSTVAGGGGSTLSGYVDGVGAVARFNYPNGILYLSTGDLVVADHNNNIIRKITSSGMYTPTHTHIQIKYIHTNIHTYRNIYSSSPLLSCSSSSISSSRSYRLLFFSSSSPPFFFYFLFFLSLICLLFSSLRPLLNICVFVCIHCI